MGNVISNLKAKFGVDTSDFKKGLKDGEKATSEFKDAAGDSINEFGALFGVNMSGVGDAVGMASKSLSFLRQSFIAAATGADVLSLASKLLKWTLTATGIGALVVLLGSVAAYFMKSAEGGGKFAKILAEIKAVFNDVIERFVIFGKGVAEMATGKFKQGWTDMKEAFKGIGDEIKEDVKQAGLLAEAEEALKKKEIDLIVSLSARKAKYAELREKAKEESTDIHDKMDLLKQAETLNKGIFADEISQENERLRIMKANLALQTKDPTLDQQREIAEQVAKINDLYRAQSDEQRGLDKQLNTVSTSLEKINNQFKSFSNIKMPDLLAPYKKSMESMKKVADELKHSFIETKEVGSDLFLVMGQIGVNIGGELKSALQSAAVGVGEFLGNMMALTAGAGDFGAVIKGAFADLLVTIGTAMIAAGIAKLNFDSLMLVFGGAPGVIAAGIAAVAVGTALKSGIGRATSSGSRASVSGSGYGSSSASSVSASPIKISITGKLVGDGRSIIAVIDEVQSLKSATT